MVHRPVHVACYGRPALDDGNALNVESGRTHTDDDEHASHSIEIHLQHPNLKDEVIDHVLDIDSSCASDDDLQTGDDVDTKGLPEYAPSEHSSADPNYCYICNHVDDPTMIMDC